MLIKSIAQLRKAVGYSIKKTHTHTHIHKKHARKNCRLTANVSRLWPPATRLWLNEKEEERLREGSLKRAH